MEYVSLKKIHYKQPDVEEEVYQRRFHSDLTRHLGLDIKQYNHRNAYPAFLCYTENMMMLQEKINKRYEDFLLTRFPPTKLSLKIKTSRSTQERLVFTLQYSAAV